MGIIPEYNQFLKANSFVWQRYIPVPKYSCTIWEGGFPVLFTSLYCTRKAAVDWNTADSVREKCDWVLSSPWMAFGGKPSVVLQRRQQSKNLCHRGDMMRCNIHQGQGDKWFIQKLNARTHASSQKRKDFNRLTIVTLFSHSFWITRSVECMYEVGFPLFFFYMSKWKVQRNFIQLFQF